MLLAIQKAGLFFFWLKKKVLWLKPKKNRQFNFFERLDPNLFF